VVSVFTAVLCGLIPALQSARLDIEESLKDGGRPAGGTVRSRVLYQAFVVAQVAITVVLLAAAGLMLGSLSNLMAVDPGFDGGNVLTFHIALGRNKYETDEKVLQFYRRLKQTLQEMPQVRTAGILAGVSLARSRRRCADSCRRVRRRSAMASTFRRACRKNESDSARGFHSHVRLVEHGFLDWRIAVNGIGSQADIRFLGQARRLSVFL